MQESGIFLTGVAQLGDFVGAMHPQNRLELHDATRSA
jgi:hypothetical protein